MQRSPSPFDSPPGSKDNPGLGLNVMQKLKSIVTESKAFAGCFD
jgi:hypothetical protein